MSEESQELVRPEEDERVRSIVWKHLGSKNAREVAELAGVTPDVVMRIKKELLDTTDSLTVQQHQTRILKLVDETATQAIEWAHEIANSGNPDRERSLGPVLTSANQFLKLATQMLKETEAKNTAQVEALNQLRIRELYDTVVLMMEFVTSDLVEDFGLDRGAIDKLFQSALSKAVEKLGVELGQ